VWKRRSPDEVDGDADHREDQGESLQQQAAKAVPEAPLLPLVAFQTHIIFVSID